MKPFDVEEYKREYSEFKHIENNIIIKKYKYHSLTFIRNSRDIFSDEDESYYWSCVVLSHFLVLQYGKNGRGTNGMVGRISSASAGSVSASTEYNIPMTNSSAWWNQTQYGAMVWAMLASIPVFEYIC